MISYAYDIIHHQYQMILAENQELMISYMISSAAGGRGVLAGSARIRSRPAPAKARAMRARPSRSVRGRGGGEGWRGDARGRGELWRGGLLVWREKGWGRELLVCVWCVWAGVGVAGVRVWV